MHFGERISDEGELSTQASKEPTKVGFHNLPNTLSPQRRILLRLASDWPEGVFAAGSSGKFQDDTPCGSNLSAIAHIHERFSCSAKRS